MSRIPRTIVVLGFVSLFTDVSSEMIYPLLPVFLAGMTSQAPLVLGLIEGAAETTASLLKIVSGVLTDRTGRRKPFVVFGYSLSSVMRPLMGFASAWPAVFAVRIADRIGKGLRTAPRDALIADVAHAEARGATFGFHRSMDHLGAVLGPLVATVLLAGFGLDLPAVFRIAAVPGVIVVLLVVFVLKEPEEKVRPEHRPFRPFEHLRTLGPRYRRLLLAVVIVTLGNSTDAFLLLRLHDAGVATGWIALLWSALHVTKLLSNLAGGRLADRFGRRPVLASGWLYYAIIYGLFAAVDSQAAVITVFIAYGVFYGLTEPVERAWVADSVPPEQRGEAYGLYNAAIGVAALPSSVLFGFVWKTFGAPAAFFMGAAFALIAVALLATIEPATRQT